MRILKYKRVSKKKSSRLVRTYHFITTTVVVLFQGIFYGERGSPTRSELWRGRQLYAPLASPNCQSHPRPPFCLARTRTRWREVQHYNWGLMQKMNGLPEVPTYLILRHVQTLKNYSDMRHSRRKCRYFGKSLHLFA